MSPCASAFSAADEIYLLSHSIGLAPRTLRQYLKENYFDIWENNPENAWPEWLAAIEGFRDALAGLFADSAANFCPQANVSSATTKILYSLANLRGRTLLLSEEAFPSLGYVFQQAKACGFDVKYVPSAANVEDPGVWKEQLSPDVGLVLLTHVHSNSGVQIPVKDIVRIARTHDVVSIVDTAQSNGVLPIDLKDWSADFVVGSCVKWLCGGPGAGFLWANPDILQNAKPIDVGWFSHAEPFEFDIHEFRYATDALRFWGGTPSVLPFVAARHSLELINEIGVAAIRAHNLDLTEHLLDAIDDSMLVSPRDASRRSGTIVIDPGKRSDIVAADLTEARVRFDRRASGIRLSPHIYNTLADIDAVTDCLRIPGERP